MVSVTVSPGLASPPTVPVTGIVVDDSAPLMTLSSVTGVDRDRRRGAQIDAVGMIEGAENGLPAASVPPTTACTDVFAASALPGTSML